MNLYIKGFLYFNPDLKTGGQRGLYVPSHNITKGHEIHLTVKKQAELASCGGFLLDVIMS